jgi:putative sigma-54 modulation protein
VELQVKGRNLDVSESIRNYAEQKLSKLDRQLSNAQVELELIVEGNPSIAANQVAEATVRARGLTLRARESARDMKAAIDQLTDKLTRQAAHERDKRQNRRYHRGPDKRDGVVPPIEQPE